MNAVEAGIQPKYAFRISMCRQTSKGTGLHRKGFQAEAQLWQKCNYREREPVSVEAMGEQDCICGFETVRHPAPKGTSEHGEVSGFQSSVGGRGRQGLDRLPQIPLCIEGQRYKRRVYA